MGRPVLPKNKVNPNGVGRITVRANADTRRRFAVILDKVLQLFSSIPFVKVDQDTGDRVYNSLVVNADEYRYLIDAFRLQQMSNQILAIIRTELHDSVFRWYLEPYVIDSYDQGTADSVINLAAVSDGVYNKTVEEVLSSPAYRDRIAFASARVYEEMEGLTQSMKTDLARTIGNGMAAGNNPREVADEIRDRIGVNQSRAIRIARTEINQAHRRARWEQAESASKQFGVRTKLMHISALIPDRTRQTHAARHGHVYTRKEVEDWYMVDGNSVNCLCTQVEVLVDEKGRPVDKGLVKRVTESGKIFFDQFGTAAKGKKAA